MILMHYTHKTKGSVYWMCSLSSLLCVSFDKDCIIPSLVHSVSIQLKNVDANHLEWVQFFTCGYLDFDVGFISAFDFDSSLPHLQTHIT